MQIPKITISGSYHKHFDRIVEAKRGFERAGADVLRPRSETISSQEQDIVRLEGDPDNLRAIQEAQLEAIRECDLLYVVNPGGYLGPSTTLEVGYAHRQGTPVVTSEPPFERAVEGIIAAVAATPQDALQSLRNENAL